MLREEVAADGDADETVPQWRELVIDEAGVFRVRLWRKAPGQGAGDPEAYLDVEPLFAQGRIVLLDHPELAREFKNLERRPRPGGRTEVDHPAVRHCHDDHANATALAAGLAMRRVAAGAEALVLHLSDGRIVTASQDAAERRAQALNLPLLEWSGDPVLRDRR